MARHLRVYVMRPVGRTQSSRGRGRGGEGRRTTKFPSWPILVLREDKHSAVLSSAGAKGAESGSKRTPDSAPISPMYRFPVCRKKSRLKRAPKPDPVKPRPPAARRFYFTELAVPLVYIFVSSHVHANVANAAPVPGYRRDPPRRFIFSAAPIAPHRSALLASP